MTARPVVYAIFFTLLGASLVAILDHSPALAPLGAARAEPQTRDYYLDMVDQDIDMGGGAVWHAWTFNHSVPGPTLVATVGDHLRVHVTNSMNLTHSFHTHLSAYPIASDGSQMNTITGIGGMAMIPPGGNYTYDFVATAPGLLYYHDHAADAQHGIQQHIAQGLYGAIIVKAVDEPPIDDQVVFMAERGFDVSSLSAPYYIMNGKGIPGGERTLESIFMSQGVPGIVAQLNKTVPVLNARVGVPIRIDVINIGDMVHSFHLHGMTAYLDDGKPLPAQVLGLDPGEANRVTVTPTEAGLWLFHCHVVSHADAGMIGVMVVQPAVGQLDLPKAAASMDAGHTNDSTSVPTPSGSVSEVSVTSSVGSGGELSFTPDHLEAKAGMIHVTFKNGGVVPHTFAIPALGVDTGPVAPGASTTVMITAKAGTYTFQCAIPGHAGAGMTGTLTVA